MAACAGREEVSPRNPQYRSLPKRGFSTTPRRSGLIPYLPSGYSSLARGAHLPAFAAKRSSLPPGVRAKFLASRSRSTRICPHLASGVFASMGYAGEAARLLLVFSRGGAPITPSRSPDKIPCVSFEIDPHLPAFGVHADSGDSGMIAKLIASLKDMEFPKNSINIDKFSGFFGKLPTNFRGEMRGIAGMCAGENPPPQKRREHTTALQAGAQR